MSELLLIAKWSHQSESQQLPLFGQTIRVGHDPYCDIEVLPEFTPRAPYHAVIYFEQRQWYIADANQVRSLYFNGKKVTTPEKFLIGRPAYIGNPTHKQPHLRLILEEPQLTVAVSGFDWDAPTLPTKLNPPSDQIPVNYPYLEGGWSDAAPQTILLTQGVMLVGRSMTANIIIPADFSFVSGLHFQLQAEPNGIFLQDRGSTNGTFLNRERVAPLTWHVLNDGDVISIQVPETTQAVWFIFHDPLHPKPPQIQPIRADSSVNTPSVSLWGRVRQFLGLD